MLVKKLFLSKLIFLNIIVTVNKVNLFISIHLPQMFHFFYECKNLNIYFASFSLHKK